MDSRTVSCYFIVYSERSRGYKFYDLTTKSIFETGIARFFEDVKFDGGDKDMDFVFEEEYVDIPTIVIDIDQAPIPDIVQEADPNQNNIQEPPVPEEQTLPPPEPTPLRRSTIERRSAVLDDYIVFLQEHEFDIGAVTPQTRGSVDYPSTGGNTRECRVTRHFSRKSGRVSFVRGALPRYKPVPISITYTNMDKNGLLGPYYNILHNI